MASAPPVTCPRRGRDDLATGLAMGILIVAAFMDLVDVTIVNVALPSIRTDLHATSGPPRVGAQWLHAGVRGAADHRRSSRRQPGPADHVPVRRRRASPAHRSPPASPGPARCCSSDRVVQGAFAAMMVPQMLSSVQALYAPRERAAVFGIVGAVSGTAAVIGPLLGGWLITHDAFGIGWRSIFLINVPVGVVLFVLALMYVPNTSVGPGTADRRAGRAACHRRDVPAGVPADPGAVARLADLDLADDRRIVVVLAAFVVTQRATERRTGSSLLPMHLFANRGFSAGLVTQAVFQGSLAGSRSPRSSTSRRVSGSARSTPA